MQDLGALPVNYLGHPWPLLPWPALTSLATQLHVAPALTNDQARVRELGDLHWPMRSFIHHHKHASKLKQLHAAHDS